jgi:intracellular sulfur oxidation DsrE/DsrF family protein
MAAFCPRQRPPPHAAASSIGLHLCPFGQIILDPAAISRGRGLCKTIEPTGGSMKSISRTLSAAVIAGSVLVLAAAMPAAAEESSYDKQKVVYHVNYYGAKEEEAALRNVQNHVNAVGAENIEVQVVLHGDGLAMLLYPDSVEGTKMKEGNANDDMQSRIAGLKEQGVKFKVCANTLTGRGVEKDDLYDVDDTDIVPSGVAELSKLQGQGFTYIKP